MRQKKTEKKEQKKTGKKRFNTAQNNLKNTQKTNPFLKKSLLFLLMQHNKQTK